jgi:CPA1 family monovalent cation:H+ antiporter
VQLDWKERVLVSWTGMRGIVTLATAAAVPITTAAGDPFPGRSSILFIAFVVAIGTLVIQGATLPLISRRLAIDTAADTAEYEAAMAEVDRIADDLGPDATPTEQRAAIAQAVIEQRIDDEFARVAIHRIDLQQAADEPDEE